MKNKVVSKHLGVLTPPKPISSTTAGCVRFEIKPLTLCSLAQMH